MILNNEASSHKSILVLGATGRTGLECIRELSNHKIQPQIHAFCRDASKLDDDDKRLCTSVVQGDAKSSTDLERALSDSHADVVIVSLGNGDSVAKSNLRTASAQALAKVLVKPNFQHVQALIVSSTGAGSSRIIVGMGIGKIISFHLRHVLKDHTGQEEAFLASSDLRQRTCVIRATALTENKATGKLVTFGDTDKSPSIETDRADLAAFITKEVCEGKMDGGNGKTLNVTGVKI